MTFQVRNFAATSRVGQKLPLAYEFYLAVVAYSLVTILCSGCDSSSRQPPLPDGASELRNRQLAEGHEKRLRAGRGQPDPASHEARTADLEPANASRNNIEVVKHTGASETKRPADLATLSTRLPAANDPLPSSVMDLFNEGRLEGEYVVARFSQDPSAYEMLARIHLLAGEFREAERAWRAALKLSPNFAYAYHGLGQVAGRRGDFATAAKHHHRAVKYMPGYTDAILHAAGAFTQIGLLGDAESILLGLVAQQPDDFTAWTRLGQTYIAAGEYNQAHRAFQNALSASPDQRDALHGTAIALARLDRPEEALQVKQHLAELCRRERAQERKRRQHDDDLKIQSREMAGKFSTLGTFYLSKRDHVNAERILIRAARLDPTNLASRTQLTGLYIGLREGELAAAVCRELIELEPDNVRHHMNYGLVQMHLNQFDKAICAFEECVALQRSATMLGYLAQAYRRHGENEEALKTIDEAIELSSNDESLKELRGQWLHAP